MKLHFTDIVVLITIIIGGFTDNWVPFFWGIFFSFVVTLLTWDDKKE